MRGGEIAGSLASKLTLIYTASARLHRQLLSSGHGLGRGTGEGGRERGREREKERKKGRVDGTRSTRRQNDTTRGGPTSRGLPGGEMKPSKQRA